jgi:hypothetical protein
MTAKLTRTCQPADGDHGQPAECRATFTVDGQRGHQKYPGGGIFTLQADDPHDETYLWEVTSSPPQCDYLLTGTTQPQARLSLPGPGAYVVQLTVSKGSCRDQRRVILWVATPNRLYRLPATSEPLRFDGKSEWPGDLATALIQVDQMLPTLGQKAAMDKANRPTADNPFATLKDLPGSPGEPGGDLTPDELAAIQAAEAPTAANPFVTTSVLHDQILTPEQKAALDAAEDPDQSNPFVTASQLERFVPTTDQRAALDHAEAPSATNPSTRRASASSSSRRAGQVGW